MNSITLENYRCFREKQTARLAPLTLLVGENSTGKTSFLAMIRALWDVVESYELPDFREDPYDLGAFEDIAYNRGVSDKEVADSFESGVVFSPHADEEMPVSFFATFRERSGLIFPAIRKLANKDYFFEVEIGEDLEHTLRFGETKTGREKWEYKSKLSERYRGVNSLYPLEVLRWVIQDEANRDSSVQQTNGEPWDEGDWDKINRLSGTLRFSFTGHNSRPFASAPVRSRPKRTYDPIRLSPDAEGDYIPTYLANLARHSKGEWRQLKDSLERFGQDSGLFDEIAIESFGRTEGSPFQVHVRKFGKRLKGRGRNLIDVGYGVSQVLPVLAELVRPEARATFLLQQPEVHLHPSAQAALGGLFCTVAASGRQLIVETHSDYIIDRVRMDIRDKNTALQSDDVSILYFERNELEVNIHSMQLDEMGNLLEAPEGYRQFFADELRRSVGL